MKKILGLVLISALGGILTLSAYKLFLEPKQGLVLNTNEQQPTFLPATNTITNLNKSALNTDFTEAAKNTIHAVVHVSFKYRFH